MELGRVTRALSTQVCGKQDCCVCGDGEGHTQQQEARLGGQCSVFVFN